MKNSKEYLFFSLWLSVISVNIYKKMGMKLEWTLRKHYFNNGKYIDGVVYSFFNKKFIAPRFRKA